MKNLGIAATIAAMAVLLVPAAGLAWEVGRPADLTADERNQCPMTTGTACPATAGIEFSRLAIAAEQGCPFSMTRLIEKAQRCADEETAGLARQAAEGNEEARAELIKRVRTLMPDAPGPANPANVA